MIIVFIPDQDKWKVKDLYRACKTTSQIQEASRAFYLEEPPHFRRHTIMIKCRNSKYINRHNTFSVSRCFSNFFLPSASLGLTREETRSRAHRCAYVTLACRAKRSRTGDAATFMIPTSDSHRSTIVDQLYSSSTNRLPRLPSCVRTSGAAARRLMA